MEGAGQGSSIVRWSSASQQGADMVSGSTPDARQVRLGFLLWLLLAFPSPGSVPLVLFKLLFQCLFQR